MGYGFREESRILILLNKMTAFHSRFVRQTSIRATVRKKQKKQNRKGPACFIYCSIKCCYDFYFLLSHIFTTFSFFSQVCQNFKVALKPCRRRLEHTLSLANKVLLHTFDVGKLEFQSWKIVLPLKYTLK